MLDNQARNIMQKERMHLGQVRKAFAAGLEQAGQGKSVPVEFLGACVDYIGASMDRLHAQDQRIHDILQPHVTPGNAADAEILANLNARLAKSRVALGELIAARDVYRARGAGGFAEFKATVDGFMDVYHNVLLKGQHSTIDLQKKVFTDADWIRVAGINEGALVIEAGAYAAVRKHAPTGADPAGFQAGPPVV
jgi:hypothetical protein